MGRADTTLGEVGYAGARRRIRRVRVTGFRRQGKVDLAVEDGADDRYVVANARGAAPLVRDVERDPETWLHFLADPFLPAAALGDDERAFLDAQVEQGVGRYEIVLRMRARRLFGPELDFPRPMGIPQETPTDAD